MTRRLTRAAEVTALGVFLVLVFVAAFAGGAFTSRGIGPWYDGLVKPGWTPPGVLIGAVWSVLYTFMGIAAWLVWREGGLRAHRAAFALFTVQLALNVAWSALFFGLRAPGWALGEIVVLAAAVLATLLAFWRIRVLAGAMFVPYFAWVLFAGHLNFTIWRLNS